ncbi:MAG: hypothetical protein EHM42_06320, partial [Planctomycetaceae bacterium]
MANLQARGTTPDAWQQAIAAFHETSSACVLSVTGGGASAIARLLEVPGASHTILEAIVPYAPAALDSWLARPPEQYCSRETALAMSAAAYARAERLSGKPADSARSIESGAEPQRRLLGIGCTASLVSSRPKRGDHRVHLAVHSSDATAWVSVTLAKGAR